jgi:hypothetical protein
MSIIFSSTIKEDDIKDYTELRNILKNSKQSIGGYLVQKYREEKKLSSIDL